jgi:hypothetical protein
LLQEPQFQILSDLFILEFGSFAVFPEVNLDFIPHILEQKELRLFPPFGCGAPNLDPGLAAL